MLNGCEWWVTIRTSRNLFSMAFSRNEKATRWTISSSSTTSMRFLWQCQSMLPVKVAQLSLGFVIRHVLEGQTSSLPLAERQQAGRWRSLRGRLREAVCSLEKAVTLLPHAPVSGSRMRGTTTAGGGGQYVWDGQGSAVYSVNFLLFVNCLRKRREILYRRPQDKCACSGLLCALGDKLSRNEQQDKHFTNAFLRRWGTCSLGDRT